MQKLNALTLLSVLVILFIDSISYTQNDYITDIYNLQNIEIFKDHVSKINEPIINRFSCKPETLITPSRFDIMGKYIYAKHRTLNVKCKWAYELYAQHLRVLNNFHETWPPKNSLSDYIGAFNAILNSIQDKGFDTNYPIPVDKNGNICNGAHRLTASLVYNIDVPVITLSQIHAPVISSDKLKNAKYFVKAGLAEKYLDAMALQYCELKKDSYIATVYPAAYGKNNEIKKFLNKYGIIIYEKEVYLIKNGPINFILTAYDKQPWLGTIDNNFNGALNKTKACFPPHSKNPLRAFLVYFPSLDNAKKAKEKIRKLFSIQNHSVHITDNHEESIVLARSLFVSNSIHCLNNSQPKQLKNFDRYLSKYKKLLQQTPNSESFCVDGSAILSAYGLRDCADLDYLHHDKKLSDTRDISSHNSSLHHHVFAKDDIIYDPKNHFYYKGIKFASLNVLKAMKTKRNETKDQADLLLINKVSI